MRFFKNFIKKYFQIFWLRHRFSPATQIALKQIFHFYQLNFHHSDKINITHIFPKPGWGPEVRASIQKFKKVWADAGQSVAVYQASSSGPTQYVLVTRYKQGLKERATGFRKPIKERYEAANGEDSWDDYFDSLKTSVESSWSELLFYRADLSSK